MRLNNLFTAVVLTALAAPASAEEITLSDLTVPKEAQEAAIQSLQIFRQLATAPNQPDIIAGGPGAAAEVSLGVPIQDSVIRLSEFRKWDGKDPSTLVHLTGRLIFPIVSKGGDRQITQSSMTLAKRDGLWKAVEFGSVAEALSRTRIEENIMGTAPKAPGANPPLVFQVRFRELNISFLASQVDDALLFTSMETVPSLELELGKTGPARDVLLRLQPIADKLEPGAPN